MMIVGCFIFQIFDENNFAYNATTGELVYVNQTSSGRPLQFKFIGKEPSKEYLNKVIPRKIRVWLGI